MVSGRVGKTSLRHCAALYGWGREIALQAATTENCCYYSNRLGNFMLTLDHLVCQKYLRRLSSPRHKSILHLNQEDDGEYETAIPHAKWCSKISCLYLPSHRWVKYCSWFGVLSYKGVKRHEERPPGCMSLWVILSCKPVKAQSWEVTCTRLTSYFRIWKMGVFTSWVQLWMESKECHKHFVVDSFITNVIQLTFFSFSNCISSVHFFLFLSKQEAGTASSTVIF